MSFKKTNQITTVIALACLVIVLMITLFLLSILSPENELVAPASSSNTSNVSQGTATSQTPYAQPSTRPGFIGPTAQPHIIGPRGMPPKY